MRTQRLAWLAIAPLILSMQTSAAQGTGSMPVRSFDGVDELMSFEIEGINLNTPMADVADILEARGYVLADEQSTLRVFTKGKLQGGHYSIPGELAYKLQITDTDMHRTIFLLRPPPKMSAPQAKQVQQPPVPESVDAKIGTELKALICAHISQAKEKQRYCRPDTAHTIGFIATRALGLSKNPQTRAWIHVQGNSGGVRVTRYK